MVANAIDYVNILSGLYFVEINNECIINVGLGKIIRLMGFVINN